MVIRILGGKVGTECGCKEKECKQEKQNKDLHFFPPLEIRF